MLSEKFTLLEETMLHNRIFMTISAIILLMAFLAGQGNAAFGNSVVHAQAGVPAIDFETVAIVPAFLRGLVTQAVAERLPTLPDDDLFYSTSFRFSETGDEARIVLVPAYVVETAWENLTPGDIVEIWLQHQSGGAWTIQPNPVHAEASSSYRFPWTSGHTWYKNGGFHQGLSIDFQPQSSDTSVLAASDGTLEVTCARGVDGQTWLSVGSAIYAHLDADSVPTNLIGKQVQRGQKIGELFADLPSSPKPGSCGYGFGAHLHFIFPNTGITMYDVIEARNIPASEMGIDTGIGQVSYTSNNVPVNTPDPDGFDKSSPSDNSQVEAPNVTLEWDAPNPAPGWYRVCLKAGEPCNGNGDDAWENNYTTSVTRTDLLPDTTYYWDVQAKYDSGLTLPTDSGWWSFTTISAGFTISGNAGVDRATLTYDNDGPRSAMADGNGNYSINVPENWSGTITPRKTGFTFIPPSMTYENVADNLSGQDYEARVRITGNAGIAGATLSYVNDGPKTVTSNSNGNYTIPNLPLHWSGTVTPSLTGYTFSPASLPYNDLLKSKSSQNYVAKVQVSGNIGIGSGSVNVQTCNPTCSMLPTYTADVNGYYSFQVQYLSAGTVTPQKTCYTFSPPSHSYSSATANMVLPAFTATLKRYTISGQTGAGLAGVTLSYTDGTPKTVTTDLNGNYTIPNLPCGWSGTVTPSDPNVIFVPASQAYNNLQTSPSGQDYAPKVQISGNAGMPYAVIYYGQCPTPNTCTSDGPIIAAANGDYTLTLPWGLQTEVAPFEPDMVFSPFQREYNVLTSHQTGQNFTATPYVPPTTYTISGNVGAGGITLFYTVPQGYMGTGEAHADAQGNYSITVPADYTGTVTPYSSQYIFTPSGVPYSGVMRDQSQNYTASPLISGRTGVAGATLSYTDDGIPKTAVSDSNGHYSFWVKSPWTSTVTISKPGVTFSPASHAYNNVTTPQDNQNYPVLMTFASNAAYDGWVLESSETSSVGGSIDNTTTTFRVGDDAAKRQYRSILSFGTGSLPNIANIQSAVLKIRQCGAPVGANPFTELGSLKVDIREGPFGAAALQVTDFQATESGWSVAAFNETPPDAWHSATLNATGRGYINAVSGVTQFRLRFSIDDNNDTAANYLRFCSSDAATVENRPYLTITYLLP
jgi:hypothetical protein